MSDPFGARAVPVRFPKNNKFAEHLAGRFFVPGVSGGFRKTRSTDALDGNQASNRKAVIEAIKDCNQTQKLKRMRRDARRQLGLERKRLEGCIMVLQHSDHISENDGQEYVANTYISNVSEICSVDKSNLVLSIHVIIDFLKILTRHKAIIAAGCAAGVIIRFVNMVKSRYRRSICTSRYKERKREKQDQELIQVQAQEQEQVEEAAQNKENEVVNIGDELEASSPLGNILSTSRCSAFLNDLIKASRTEQLLLETS